MRPLVVDGALWATLAAVWLVSAWRARGGSRRESLATRARYAPFVVGGFALFDPALTSFAWLDERWLAESDPVSAASIVTTAAGVAFAVWGRLALGRQWSGQVTVGRAHRLVQSGPYAFARHPIYAGVVVAALGTAVAEGSGRAFLGTALLVAGFGIKARAEDRLLARTFGEAHATYRARVRRWVPFV